MSNCFPKNLQIGEAAKRNVGTGNNQIPDMSAWTAEYGSGTLPSGWRRNPAGEIEQFFSINIPQATQGVVIVPVTFPIPFPRQILSVRQAIFRTADPSSRFVGIYNSPGLSGMSLSVVTNTPNDIFISVLGR